MAILPDWYTFNMYWTGHIPVQQNQHIETFFWMYGIVLISLLKLEVYKCLRSKQISLRRVYLLWYLWRLFLYCAIKWLHLNRWCHLSTFCFGDIISIGDIYYLFKLILKYSIIRWMVSHIGNSDIIS